MDKHTQYRMIIMDNYSSPNNQIKGDEDLSEYNAIETLTKKNCADKFFLYFQFANGKIIKGLFKGHGCAISTASTNLLLNELVGKTYEEALQLLSSYKDLVLTGNGDIEQMKDLIVFETVYKLDNRKSCALMSAESIEKLLKEQNVK